MIDFFCLTERDLWHKLKLYAGWSSLVARRAHNPKVNGSNPFPATKKIKGLWSFSVTLLLFGVHIGVHISLIFLFIFPFNFAQFLLSDKIISFEHAHCLVP